MLKSPVVFEDLPSVEGMRQLDAILDIIKNATTYKKRLDELKNKHSELVDLIKTVGEVNSIHDIRDQAQVEKLKITGELEGLQAKKDYADEVIAEAKVRSMSIEADASSRARDQKSILDMREKELSEGQKQLKVRDEELRKAEETMRGSQLAVGAELSRLKQLQESATKSRMELQDRKAQIEKVLSGV